MLRRPEPAFRDYDPKLGPRPSDPYHILQEVDGEAWQSYSPTITGQQAKDILRRDLPPLGNSNIIIRVAPDGYGTLEIKHEDFDEERTFNLRDKVVDFGVLRVDENREQGVGRHVLRNEIDLFRALGAKVFNVHASDAGGYMMARLGALPDDVSDSDFIARTRNRVTGILDAVSPLLTESERKPLAKAAAFADAKDMWRLADAQLDLSSRLKTLFAKAASGDAHAVTTKEKLLSALNNTYFAGNGGRIIADINERVAAGKSVSAGRLLLAGTYWEGHIDLNDAEQLNRVDAYTGGLAPRP
ncbi:MAG TPA: hypothetical protein VL625_06025 [Patescibacteria group bacterium]|nr:hypothetical protein [Patescibacteria group bacterium]